VLEVAGHLRGAGRGEGAGDADDDDWGDMVVSIPSEREDGRSKR
jgi:hypothetical protein